MPTDIKSFLMSVLLSIGRWNFTPSLVLSWLDIEMDLDAEKIKISCCHSFSRRSRNQFLSSFFSWNQIHQELMDLMEKGGRKSGGQEGLTDCFSSAFILLDWIFTSFSAGHRDDHHHWLFRASTIVFFHRMFLLLVFLSFSCTSTAIFPFRLVIILCWTGSQEGSDTRLTGNWTKRQSETHLMNRGIDSNQCLVDTSIISPSFHTKNGIDTQTSRVSMEVLKRARPSSFMTAWLALSSWEKMSMGWVWEEHAFLLNTIILAKGNGITFRMSIFLHFKRIVEASHYLFHE